MYHCEFVIIIPWKRSWHHHHQWCISSSLVEIGPVVLEKKIFAIIFIISLLSPFGKRCGPSFKQTLVSFTQGCFVQILVDTGEVVLDNKMKMWKVYGQTVRRKDRRQATRNANMSFKLRWAKKYKNLYQDTKHHHYRQTKSALPYNMFVCLLVWGFSSHLRIFHSHWDVTITS